MVLVGVSQWYSPETCLEGGKVDDRVNSGVLLEDLVEGLLVGNVELVEVGAAAADELDAVEGNLGGVVEVVDDDDVVAVLEQGQRGEGTNVAGSTGRSQSVQSVEWGQAGGWWMLLEMDSPGDQNSAHSHCA